MAAAAAGADAADAANNQAALLLDAVERGDAAAIDALLAAGADANARVDVDEGGGCVRPLFKAAEKGHASVISVLLNHGADVNAADGLGPPDPSLLDLVPDADDVVQQLGCTALHFAARGGHVDAARLLLERGADVNAATAPDDRPHWHGGCQPLHLAAVFCHAAVVKLLVSRGADVRAAATWDGDTNLTPLHLSLGAIDVCRTSSEAVATTAALLDAGATVNAGDDLGQQALHRAIGYNTEAVALLLARGANVNAADKFGAAPLHLACLPGNSRRMQMVVLLLKHGADARAADRQGRHPLHYLAHREPWEDTVIDEETNEDGDHDAGEGLCARLVRALVSSGADIDAVDYEGNTPLMLAFSSSYDAAVTALLRWRARVGPPVCVRCAATDEVRAGVQGAVVDMAAEAVRLRRQQAVWEKERAALARQQAAWEKEREALARQQAAWVKERAALARQQAAWEQERAALQQERAAARE